MSNDGSKTILFLLGGLAESIIFVLCCSPAEVFLLHQGHVEIKTSSFNYFKWVLFTEKLC